MWCSFPCQTLLTGVYEHFFPAFNNCCCYTMPKTGACDCRALIQCLRRMGPAHCYATSMSPPAVEQVLSAMHVLRNKDGSGRGPAKIQQLHDNANYFRHKLQSLGCSVLGSSDSPVMVSTSSLLELLYKHKHKLRLYLNVEHKGWTSLVLSRVNCFACCRG